MPKYTRRQHPATSPKEWAKKLIEQPAAALYQRPSVYMSGDEIEVQNFRAVVDYNQAYLIIDLGRELMRITGDALVIVSMEKGRVVVRGRVLGISFSDEG